MRGRVPLPQGGAQLADMRRHGEPFAQPVAVRLWDQVRAVTANVLTAYPGRDPRAHDWSPVAELDVAVHISDATSADEYCALVEGLIRAKAATIFVVHHPRGCVAIVRNRGRGGE